MGPSPTTTFEDCEDVFRASALCSSTVRSHRSLSALGRTQGEQFFPLEIATGEKVEEEYYTFVGHGSMSIGAATSDSSEFESL